MDKQKTYTVFTYGSLKHGFGNHYLLEDQKYLGPAKTKTNDYIMVSLGGFPAVAEYKDKFKISGELYEVDSHTLQALDQLEGNGSLYTRVEKDIDLGGKTVKAWIYLMPLNMAQMYYSRVANKRPERVILENEALCWFY